MKKFHNVNKKAGNLLFALLTIGLLGCETPKQSYTSTPPQGYTALDKNNAKDQEFYSVLEKSLKKLGSLLSVSANTEELNLYRQGEGPYPTNYRYEIKASPKVSLEEIKQANLSAR